MEEALEPEVQKDSFFFFLAVLESGAFIVCWILVVCLLLEGRLVGC
jgi:hypothetical protein